MSLFEHFYQGFELLVGNKDGIRNKVTSRIQIRIRIRIRIKVMRIRKLIYRYGIKNQETKGPFKM
jgi:hypothetical protein